MDANLATTREHLAPISFALLAHHLSINSIRCTYILLGIIGVETMITVFVHLLLVHGIVSAFDDRRQISETRIALDDRVRDIRANGSLAPLHHGGGPLLSYSRSYIYHTFRNWRCSPFDGFGQSIGFVAPILDLAVKHNLTYVCNPRDFFAGQHHVGDDHVGFLFGCISNGLRRL